MHCFQCWNSKGTFFSENSAVFRISINNKEKIGNNSVVELIRPLVGSISIMG